MTVQENKTIPISALDPTDTPHLDWLIPAIGYDPVAQIFRGYRLRLDQIPGATGGGTDAHAVHYSQAVAGGAPGSAAATLNAEIAALIAAGGGTLRLGPGIYDTTGVEILVDLSAISVRMASRICIQGEGNATTIKNTTGAAFAYTGNVTSPEAYFQLRDLRFLGNNVATSIGVTLSRGAFISLKNVTVEGFDLGLDMTDVDQSLFQGCQFRFNKGGVRMNFASGVTDPNSITFIDTVIGNNSVYGLQASNVNQLTYLGGNFQYNGVIGGPSSSYGCFLSDTGSGYGTVLFAGTSFEGNGGAGDFVSQQISPGADHCNILFSNVSFMRTTNFITVGYGTNQVSILGNQPNANYVFHNCNFYGKAGYTASALRPAIANVNPNARIEISGLTEFWSTVEAPATSDIFSGKAGARTGRMVLASATGGTVTLIPPATAANRGITFPDVNDTLAYLTNPVFPFNVFAGSFVGGSLPNSRAILASTSSGAPAGDIVDIIGSTIKHTGAVCNLSDISPAQITADQNDYNPTGLSTASVLRISSDASRKITGLQGGQDGRILTLMNVGTNPIILQDSNAGSAAANRFALIVDTTLGPKQSISIIYDATSLLWRPLSLSNVTREVLLAARTYFVRSDGVDTNNGLANTAAGAFLTIQKAIDTVAGLDLSIYNVTIQVADGTYTGALTVTGPWIGSGTVTLLGNTVTPANAVITTAVAGATAVLAQLGARLTIAGFKLVSSGTGATAGLRAASSSNISVTGAMDYGAANRQIAAYGGGSITVTVGYNISAGAVSHWFVSSGSSISIEAITITTSGTPAFSGAFATIGNLGCAIVDGNVFSGTGATGVRYAVSGNGVLFTNGAGATYLPGNAAGTTATGGQYT